MSELSVYHTVFTFKNIQYKVQTPSGFSLLHHEDVTMKNCDFHKKWKEELYKGNILVKYDRSDGISVKILPDGREIMSLTPKLTEYRNESN